MALRSRLEGTLIGTLLYIEHRRLVEIELRGLSPERVLFDDVESMFPSGQLPIQLLDVGLEIELRLAALVHPRSMLRPRIDG